MSLSIVQGIIDKVENEIVELEKYFDELEVQDNSIKRTVLADIAELHGDLWYYKEAIKRGIINE